MHHAFLLWETLTTQASGVAFVSPKSLISRVQSTKLKFSCSRTIIVFVVLLILVIAQTQRWNGH